MRELDAAVDEGVRVAGSRASSSCNESWRAVAAAPGDEMATRMKWERKGYSVIASSLRAGGIRAVNPLGIKC